MRSLPIMACFLALSTAALGRPATDDRGEAIGLYIGAHQALDAFQASRCGALIRPAAGWPRANHEAAAVAAVRPYVSAPETAEIAAFLPSGRERAGRMVAGLVQPATEGKAPADRQAACGAVLGILSSALATARETWNSAKAR